ncbi:MAG: DUF5110 domain-containing protein [Bacteroidetes bacterium]|jgi:alpha-glucosidase (family GH31 glycosyl hydrolase)|nr:DUF5110 domain-containing protein [Bacteroidota bacterium]
MTNQLFLKAEKYTENILRFRISYKDVFQESLTERYNIIRLQTEEIIPNASIEPSGTITMPESTGSRINQFSAYPFSDFDNLSWSDHERIRQMILKYADEPSEGSVIGEPDDIINTRENNAPDKAAKNTQGSIIKIPMQNDERFFGLGSSSEGRLQLRSGIYRIWAQYQVSEMPAPLILSTDGYGILINSTTKTYFDVGHSKENEMFIYSEGDEPDIFLLQGENLQALINQYTELTGKPYLMPQWAYGLTFCGHTQEDQFSTMNHAYLFRKNNIPIDVYSLETQWMQKNYDYSTDKQWNSELYIPDRPDFRGWKYPEDIKKLMFIHRLKSMGFNLLLWLCVDEDLSKEAENRLLLEQGENGIPGFTSWFDHLNRFLNDGARGYKLDPSYTIHENPDRDYYNGYTDKEMHLINQVLLTKLHFQNVRENQGYRPFHHYCGGYMGTQHWGASTTGDNGGAAEVVPIILNQGFNGHMNVSCDMLERVKDLKEGIHFGFLLPWSQLNSWTFINYPWLLGEEETNIFRYYSQLRYRLMPYIYSTAREGHETGMPIARAMPIVYEDDLACDTLTHQYMLGDFLLVGTYSDTIYLPEGKWINYFTGEKINGRQTIKAHVPENRGGPLFIKAGAIIPQHPFYNYIDPNRNDTLILEIYPGGNSSFTIYEDDGETFAHENGAYSKTNISVQQHNGLTIEIAPRAGLISNTPEKREIIFKIRHSKPKTISVNNSKLTEEDDWVYYQEQNETVFKVSDSKNRVKPITIYIE